MLENGFFHSNENFVGLKLSNPKLAINQSVDYALEKTGTSNFKHSETKVQIRKAEDFQRIIQLYDNRQPSKIMRRIQKLKNSIKGRNEMRCEKKQNKIKVP